MTHLEKTLQLAKQRAEKLDLTLSVVIESLKEDSYLTFNESHVHSSASTIKIPIMMSVLQLADKEFQLSDHMELRAENAVDFSVVTEIGKKSYSIEEYLIWMMIESCNASTNQMIDLVGYERVNRMVQKIGLQETILQRKMMDVRSMREGRDNLTSARDMARLLKDLYQGEYLGKEKSLQGLDIMKRCRDTNLLLRYLPDPPPFAHKTGGLDDVSHDVGIFFGQQHYLISALVTNQGEGEQDKRRTSTLGHLGRWIYEEN